MGPCVGLCVLLLVVCGFVVCCAVSGAALGVVLCWVCWW